MATTKTCKACGVTKPISEYAANNKTRDGYRHKCNECCRTTAPRRAAEARKVKAVNGALATEGCDLGIALKVCMIPGLRDICRAMEWTGVSRVVIDLDAGTLGVTKAGT